MVKEGIVLGHIESERGIEVDNQKSKLLKTSNHQTQSGRSEVSLDMMVSIDVLLKTSLR